MATRSNRASNAGEKTWVAATTYWTPPSPGPPGLKNNVPTRRRGSLARCRAIARLIFLPCGFDQFSGTLSLPHWARWLPGQGFQEMPLTAGKALLAVSPAADVVVMKVTPVLTSSTAHPNMSGRRVRRRRGGLVEPGRAVVSACTMSPSVQGSARTAPPSRATLLLDTARDNSEIGQSERAGCSLPPAATGRLSGRVTRSRTSVDRGRPTTARRAAGPASSPSCARRAPRRTGRSCLRIRRSAPLTGSARSVARRPRS